MVRGSFPHQVEDQMRRRESLTEVLSILDGTSVIIPGLRPLILDFSSFFSWE
jgi:hypothetical protein